MGALTLQREVEHHDVSYARRQIAELTGKISEIEARA